MKWEREPAFALWQMSLSLGSQQELPGCCQPSYRDGVVPPESYMWHDSQSSEVSVSRSLLGVSVSVPNACTMCIERTLLVETPCCSILMASTAWSFDQQSTEYTPATSVTPVRRPHGSQQVPGPQLEP